MLKSIWTLAKHSPIIGATLKELEDTTQRFTMYADESVPLPDNFLDMLGVSH